MFDLFFVAESAPAASATQSFGGMNLLMMGILIVGLGIYWFFLLRPHNQKRKEMQDKLSKLTKGDRVVTIGGVHGKVVSVKESLVVLRIDDKAEITFDKSAIATVLTQKNETEQEKNASESDKQEEVEKIDEKK